MKKLNNQYDLRDVKKIKLKKIYSEKGNIFHSIKKNEKSFISFGEAYFSNIMYNKVKAWKLHKKMHLNLTVPIGNVAFVFCSNYDLNVFRTEIIGEDNYCRIYVPPNIFFGFKGLSKKSNLILNVASIIHNKSEQISIDQDKLNFEWNKL